MDTQTRQRLTSFAQRQGLRPSSTDRELRLLAEDFAARYGTGMSEQNRRRLAAEASVALRTLRRRANQQIAHSGRPGARSGTKAPPKMVSPTRLREQRYRIDVQRQAQIGRTLWRAALVTSLCGLMGIALMVLVNFTDILTKTRIGTNATPPEIVLFSDTGTIREVYMQKRMDGGGWGEERRADTGDLRKFTVKSGDWNDTKAIRVRAVGDGQVGCRIYAWSGTRVSDRRQQGEISCEAVW